MMRNPSSLSGRACLAATWFALLAPALWCPSRAAAQDVSTRREVVIGTVTDGTGRAISGADVLVTPARTFQTQRTTTDSAGKFQVVVQQGTGDYLIAVTAPGYASYRERKTLLPGDVAVLLRRERPLFMLR